MLVLAVGALVPGCARTGKAGSTAAPDDRIPFTAATVTDHGGGRFGIRWTAPGAGHVKVYTGGRRDHIRTDEAVAAGAERGEVTVKVRGGAAGAVRQWFRLVPERGEPLTVADRAVRLEGAANVRDAGGYRTADGHWVRMGEVYRSGGLEHLTAADRTKLQRLGIGPVYDLRTSDEADAAPDRLPAGADYEHLNVLGDGRTIANTQPRSPRNARSLMLDSYRDFVSGKPAPGAYARMYASLASSLAPSPSEGRDEAALYHCTAGKDRTGWASAVLLRALGVPRAAVEKDYLASNQYLARFNAQALRTIPDAQEKTYKPLLRVREEYLNASFAEMRRQYGSLDGYLRKGLGIDHDELRRLRAELLVG